jgi:hypothetical protein
MLVVAVFAGSWRIASGLTPNDPLGAVWYTLFIGWGILLVVAFYVDYVNRPLDD